MFLKVRYFKSIEYMQTQTELKYGSAAIRPKQRSIHATRNFS